MHNKSEGTRIWIHTGRSNGKTMFQQEMLEHAKTMSRDEFVIKQFELAKRVGYIDSVEETNPTFRRNPYSSDVADAYTTAINILAVEYLIKADNYKEYSERVGQIYELNEEELAALHICLSLNMHTSSLGAMITQGDYEHQREALLYFLDHPEDRL